MLHVLKDAAAAPATGQAVEIAKQILEKLTDAAKAAQTTVEQALPHVVRAYMMRQIGYAAAGALILLVGLIGFIISAHPSEIDSTGDPDGWIFGAVISGLLTVIGLTALVFNMGDTFAVLADPIGAFILSLIGK